MVNGLKCRIELNGHFPQECYAHNQCVQFPKLRCDNSRPTSTFTCVEGRLIGAYLETEGLQGLAASGGSLAKIHSDRK